MTPHRNDVVHSEMARKNVPVLRTKAKFSSINDKAGEWCLQKVSAKGQ